MIQQQGLQGVQNYKSALRTLSPLGMVMNPSEPARSPHKGADLQFTPPHTPYSCSGLTPAQTSENEDEGRVLPILGIFGRLNPFL